MANINNGYEAYLVQQAANKLRDKTDPCPMGSVLTEANEVINGERQDSYGDPEMSFKTISAYWSAYLSQRLGTEVDLTALDSVHMMSLFKHARMVGQSPDRDNYRDAAGYLAIAADRLLDNA